MAKWRLAVDIGITRTKAAVAAEGIAVPVELGDDGQLWMPSAVFASEDGQVLAGDAACRLAPLLPERFEPNARVWVG